MAFVVMISIRHWFPCALQFDPMCLDVRSSGLFIPFIYIPCCSCSVFSMLLLIQIPMRFPMDIPIPVFLVSMWIVFWFDCISWTRLTVYKKTETAVIILGAFSSLKIKTALCLLSRAIRKPVDHGHFHRHRAWSQTPASMRISRSWPQTQSWSKDARDSYGTYTMRKLISMSTTPHLSIYSIS